MCSKNNRMMKKLEMALLGMALILTYFLSYAQEEAIHQPKNCIWELKAEQSSIYFVGSVHVLTQDSYPLPKIFEDIYRKSEIIVFETDLNLVNDVSFQRQFVMMGMYPTGQSLKENISKSTYKILKEYAEMLGISIQMLNGLKPWSCALLLTSIEMNRLGYDQKFGIDLHFFSKAEKDKKPIKGLESNETHVKLLNELLDRDQEVFILDTISELKSIGKNAQELVQYWQQGNAEKLNDLLNSNFVEFPELHERLILQRNRNWISRIEELMKQKKTLMVIVGTGHLVGKDSVIDLMIKKDYLIKQL